MFKTYCKMLMAIKYIYIYTQKHIYEESHAKYIFNKYGKIYVILKSAPKENIQAIYKNTGFTSYICHRHNIGHSSTGNVGKMYKQVLQKVSRGLIKGGSFFYSS